MRPQDATRMEPSPLVAAGRQALREMRPPSTQALVDEVRRHFPHADSTPIERAYAYAEAAHAEQRRVSGEPFIEHPAQVAYLLAQLGLDPVAVSAALLHDIPEDTSTTIEDVREAFGDEIARLVDGVTKLSRLGSISAEAHESENLRKLFLAMADDLRVVLIKLCDRLHNMRTLAPLPEDRRRRIARQTREIYAPLARRMGVSTVHWELEDLAFAHLEPERYQELAEHVRSKLAGQDQLVGEVQQALGTALAGSGIAATVTGRPKHLWSVWQKMQRKGVGLDDIYDLFAVRVIVREVTDCYAAIGVVHSLWRPLPGQFDDYIAVPKPSMYRSLHTAVLLPGGVPIEVQVRTEEMHAFAETGVAAHFRYKEGGRHDPRYEEKLSWVRQLLETHAADESDALSFIERLKTDLFQDQVFVFTPKGEVKDLPVGATPLDFAYRIHTEIGHHCTGARVNGRLVPLEHRLRSGDIVEVLTSRSAKGPSRDWLALVRTPHAREKIRSFFRRQARDENATHGREMLERELGRIARTRLADLPADALARAAVALNLADAEALFAAIGYGDVSVPAVLGRLGIADDARRPIPATAPARAPARGILVHGEPGLLTSLASCCHPIAGEPIIGYVTRGRGVSVHRRSCSNAATAEADRLVEVSWPRDQAAIFTVTIEVRGLDRPGLLRDVSSAVAEMGLGLAAVSARAAADGSADLRLTVAVPSLEHLSRVIAKVLGVRGVVSAARALES